MNVSVLISVVRVLLPGVMVCDRMRVLAKLCVPNVILLGTQKNNPSERQNHDYTHKGQRAPFIHPRSAMELALHVLVKRHVLLLPQRSQRVL